MTTTSTLKNVVDQLVEQGDFGRVLTSLTGTTTTLTDATANQAGPFTGAMFPRGSGIIITAGGTVGQCTYLDQYNPSTGAITVTPTITTAATDAVLVTETEIDKPDRILEAISRAMNNHVVRWQRMPLTYVPDGDLRGTTVTDYWTGTAATPTYVTPTYPAGSAAAAFGYTNVQRVLQSATTNATNRVTSNALDVALNSTVTAYQWYFQTAIRVVSGAGNAQLLVWDETNNAQITVNVIAGSSSFTHVTTSLGFINIEGTCNIPATCKQISFRLVSDSTSTTIQMAPLIAYPVDAVSFPIPNRIVTESYIGNFYYGYQTSAASGLYSVAFSEPITSNGRIHTLNDYGDHLTVTFNFRPLRPVWFDELTYDPDITTLTSTTTFPLDYVVKWARFELLDFLFQREKPKLIPYGSRAIPEPSRWLSRRNAALTSAKNSDYEPGAIEVIGRR